MLSIDWYWQGSLDNNYQLTATVTAATDSATTTTQAPQGSSLQRCQSPTIAFTTAIQLPLPATVGLTDFQQVSCYHGTYRFLPHELLLPSSTWWASFSHVGYSVRQAHTNPPSVAHFPLQDHYNSWRNIIILVRFFLQSIVGDTNFPNRVWLAYIG